MMVRSDDDFHFYINGVLNESFTGLTGKDATWSNTSTGHYIGRSSSSSYPYEGSLSKIRLHNRALSADEVEAAYNGQSVPFEYVQGLHGMYSPTFASTSEGWTSWGSGSSVSVSGGDLNVTVSSQAATSPFGYIATYLASSTFIGVPGFSYRMNITIANGSSSAVYSLIDHSGTAAMSTESTSFGTGNGTYSFTWTGVQATLGSNPLKVGLSSTVTGDTFDVTSVTIDRLGCVAEYLPSGITTNDLSATNDGTWYDSSGNGLDGVSSGATPINYGLQALTINPDGPALGANLLAIKTAGDTTFVVNEAGNVGIGTDAPASKLSIEYSETNGVTPSIEIYSNANNSEDHIIKMGRPGTSIPVGMGWDNSTNQFVIARNTSGNLSTGQKFAIKSDGITAISGVSDMDDTIGMASLLNIGDRYTNMADMSMGTDGDNRAIQYYSSGKYVIGTRRAGNAYHDAFTFWDGKLGIGTGTSTAPATPLHVYTGTGTPVRLERTGSGVWDIALDNQLDTGNTSHAMIFQSATNNTGFLFTSKDGSGNLHKSLAIKADGNVGVGTTAPAEKLEVHGTSGQLFQVSDDLDDVVFSANNISGLPVIEAKADNTVKLGKFGRNDLVVASNGHIGIGMDSPSYPFELKRSDAINTYLSTENTTVANAGVRMKNSQGEWIIIANDKLRFYDGDNSIERMAIHSDGTVVPGADNTQDLGSSSLRWANLHVADMQLSNVNTGGNEVDGTEGSWSVQEGEDDIYLINRKNGKRFKIKLEEV
jgi:hypothetical protein